MPPPGSMTYDGQSSVTIAPGAATGGTITLPAIAGKFHYITRLDFHAECHGRAARFGNLADHHHQPSWFAGSG